MERLDKKKRQLRHKKLFLLDIDGTVSFDADPIEGTMDFVRKVLDDGGKYVFITNNSTKGLDDYVKKFRGMGIPVDETSFLTSLSASCAYMKRYYPEQLIFALGTRSFVRELRACGLRVTEEPEEEIRAALVGFDNELNYSKIEKICQLLQTREIDYLATNPDLACPVGFGFVPDCGAICGMIAQAVKREPVYIGKPNRLMVDMALEMTGYAKEETVVIGDRLYTDIACGINGGVDTVAVFTGEAKREDLAETEYPPVYYCDSIKDVYESM